MRLEASGAVDLHAPGGRSLALPRSGQGVGVAVYGEAVPSTATSCSLSLPPDITLWHIRDAGDGDTPLSFSFPTPLQWKPPANTKACLYAFAAAGPANTTTMNAVGFYSG